MNAVAAAATLIFAVFLNFAANAQSSTNISSPNISGTKSAPVGHRQPRAADVPQTDSQQQIDAADRALNKSIKGICRGC